MFKLIVAVVSIHLFAPVSAIAQDGIGKKLFSQLKSNIEKSCSNDDYVNCIESTESICKDITGTQLNIIGQIIDSQSQAIAEGDISQTLAEIQNARALVLEQNGIDIDKANSCGKQFLVN